MEERIKTGIEQMGQRAPNALNKSKGASNTGAANPLAGHPLFLLKESFDNVLVKDGLHPPAGKTPMPGLGPGLPTEVAALPANADKLETTMWLAWLRSTACQHRTPPTRAQPNSANLLLSPEDCVTRLSAIELYLRRMDRRCNISENFFRASWKDCRWDWAES